MIWRACSMPDVDLAYSLPVAPSSTIAETGDALSIPGVDTAVSVAGAPETPPPAVPVRARSRGTLPVVGLFALALVTAIYLGRAILMPILFGMILAVVLAPIVEKLSRLRIPNPVGAAIVMLGVVGTNTE